MHLSWTIHRISSKYCHNELFPPYTVECCPFCLLLSFFLPSLPHVSLSLVPTTNYILIESTSGVLLFEALVDKLPSLPAVVWYYVCLLQLSVDLQHFQCQAGGMMNRHIWLSPRRCSRLNKAWWTILRAQGMHSHTHGNWFSLCLKTWLLIMLLCIFASGWKMNQCRTVGLWHTLSLNHSLLKTMFTRSEY